MLISKKHFQIKIEYSQYNEVLAITGATRNLSREIFYRLLGLETFQLGKSPNFCLLWHPTPVQNCGFNAVRSNL